MAEKLKSWLAIATAAVGLIVAVANFDKLWSLAFPKSPEIKMLEGYRNCVTSRGKDPYWGPGQGGCCRYLSKELARREGVCL